MLWEFLATGLQRAFSTPNTREIICSRDKLVKAQQKQKQNKLKQGKHFKSRPSTRTYLFSTSVIQTVHHITPMMLLSAQAAAKKDESISFAIRQIRKGLVAPHALYERPSHFDIIENS